VTNDILNAIRAVNYNRAYDPRYIFNTIGIRRAVSLYRARDNSNNRVWRQSLNNMLKLANGTGEYDRAFKSVWAQFVFLIYKRKV